jgi:hypothetical protein
MCSLCILRDLKWIPIAITVELIIVEDSITIKIWSITLIEEYIVGVILSLVDFV